MMEGQEIEHVRGATLLGVNISDRFDWDRHVESINAKASKRLYYLQQLKRAGVSTNIDLLKSIQRRALKVISPTLSCTEALEKLQTTHSQREKTYPLCKDV